MNTKKIKFNRLFKISRPRFWIYEIGPYIIGVLAASQSQYSAWLIPSTILFLIFFTYPANIYIYGINDVYDYDTDKLNPKKISYESLVMPDEQKYLLKHITFVTIPFIIIGFIFLSYQALIFLFAFLFFAGFYSATPIRAKAKPVLDSIFSAGHYIATAVFSFVMVSNILEKPISWITLSILSLAGMFWAIAMHAYSAVPDIKADSDAGLSTIATKFGKKYTVILCALLYILSGILSFNYIGYISILLILVYVLLMSFSLSADEDKFFKIYKLFPTINSISGMIIFFTILLKTL